MKKCLIFIFFYIQIVSFSQTFTLSIEREKVVDSKTYEFDIVITSPYLLLTAYQGALSFNLDIKNNGILNFSYISNTSQLFDPPISTLITDNKLSFYSFVGNDTIKGSKIVGRFRLTNTQVFSGRANLKWFLTGGVNTIILNDWTNVTDRGNFLGSNIELPIKLKSFTLTQKKDVISLYWQTVTEIHFYGFEVQRCVNNMWKTIVFIRGSGESNIVRYYSYVDKKSPSGLVKYRLKQIDIDGIFEYSKVLSCTISTKLVTSVRLITQ